MKQLVSCLVEVFDSKICIRDDLFNVFRSEQFNFQSILTSSMLATLSTSFYIVIDLQVVLECIVQLLAPK